MSDSSMNVEGRFLRTPAHQINLGLIVMSPMETTPKKNIFAKDFGLLRYNACHNSMIKKTILDDKGLAPEASFFLKNNLFAIE